MPTPPSTVATPPSPTSNAVGCAVSVARISSPRPALDARSGSSSSCVSSGSPSADAASTTAVPSGSSSQSAAIGRPSGSLTAAVRHSPPSAA